MALAKTLAAVLALACISLAAGQAVNITVNSAPYDIQATPVIPASSSRALQCGVQVNSSRFPGLNAANGLAASGTYPLTVSVPAGQRVRVIFANGNLNGNKVTAANEPGVIVLQNNTGLVQQLGGASPIVQNTSAPVLASTAPASLQVALNSPTVLQTIANPAPTQRPGTGTSAPVTPSNPAPSTPANPTPGTPANPTPGTPPTTPATPTPGTPNPAPGTPAATPRPGTNNTSPTTPAPTTGGDAPSTDTNVCASSVYGGANYLCSTSECDTVPCCKVAVPNNAHGECQGHRSELCADRNICGIDARSCPLPGVDACNNKDGSVPSPDQASGTLGHRKLLQSTVPNGPNGGVLGFVALINAPTSPGLVVPDTQFGVPYVEYTAPSTKGSTAFFNGALEFATITSGAPQFPFTAATGSPDCQVNVNFITV